MPPVRSRPSSTSWPTLPLAFQPGTRWHYSVGIDVAARLVEVISGQPLGEFLRVRLFDPLGMTDTGSACRTPKLDRLSAMYGLPDLIGENYSAVQLVEAALSGFNERIDVSATYPTDTPDVFVRGGLGLFSTAGDYMRFAQMLANNGALDGERLLEPQDPRADAQQPPPPRVDAVRDCSASRNRGWASASGPGCMLDVAQTGGTGSVGEYGWAGAAKTYYWVDPVEELVGVFMTQYMTGVLLPDRDMRSLTYQAIID